MGARPVQPGEGGEGDGIVSLQPAHGRVDVVASVVDGLSSALPGSVIRADRDASYRPGVVMTVVSVSTARQLGSLPGARWAVSATVVLSTTGPDFDVTVTESERVGDALLSLTGAGDVRFSSVRCDSEPVRLSPHNPTGAEMVSQTFSLIVRRGA